MQPNTKIDELSSFTIPHTCLAPPCSVLLYVTHFGTTAHQQAADIAPCIELAAESETKEFDADVKVAKRKVAGW